MKRTSRDVVEKRIAEIAAQQRAISEAAPEGVSTDWAWEHDWISAEEYAEAQQRWERLDQATHAHWFELRELRQRHPRAFRGYFASRRAMLQLVARQLPEMPVDSDAKELDLGYAQSLAQGLFLALDEVKASQPKGYLDTSFFWALCRVDACIEQYRGLITAPGANLENAAGWQQTVERLTALGEWCAAGNSIPESYISVLIEAAGHENDQVAVAAHDVLRLAGELAPPQPEIIHGLVGLLESLAGESGPPGREALVCRTLKQLGRSSPSGACMVREELGQRMSLEGSLAREIVGATECTVPSRVWTWQHGHGANPPVMCAAHTCYGNLAWSPTTHGWFGEHEQALDHFRSHGPPDSVLEDWGCDEIPAPVLRIIRETVDP